MAEIDSLGDALRHPIGAASAAVSSVAGLLHLEVLLHFVDAVFAAAPTIFPAVWTAIKIGPLAGIDVALLETAALVLGGVLVFKRLVTAARDLSGKLRDRL